MKLIIKQYLASLKERDELDAILPDLLSQLGLNVFSRPGRGTRQDGVDVAAVGRLKSGPEKVYLFSLKSGDLTRNSWDDDTSQSLRRSLNEIQDAYIPNRLPEEHKDKDIVICLCFGGDIQEPVRPLVEGYIKKYTRASLVFEEWNGDKLSALILTNFLREDLLPQNARSQLRKSLALLDEPDISFKHFAALIKSLASQTNSNDSMRVMAIRQINICLWILFAWTREAGNMESAFLSSEIALLHAWEIAKKFSTKKTKMAKSIQSGFGSMVKVYQQINSEYLAKNILPHSDKRHAVSTAVQGSCYLDVNLKLFDVLGRLAMGGIWSYWCAKGCSEEDAETHRQLISEVHTFSLAVIRLVSNNPALFLPIKDDQAIDISIAVLLLAIDGKHHPAIKSWLSEIADRATFAHQTHGQYPCNLHSYSELLEHPRQNDDAYRREVTSGSILFPMIALWAALLEDDDLYSKVRLIKEKHLGHSNFQLWYPDDSSEEHFYINGHEHGATLSNACIDKSKEDFLSQAIHECELTPGFKKLSAVEMGLWPLILVACRHYRVPVPIHLMKGFRSVGQSK